MDLRPTCPAPLQDLDASSTIIVCANDACKVIGKNNPTDPSCVYPNQYTELFKTSCPQAYSYPSDDKTSTFTCKGKDYRVVFCPWFSPRTRRGGSAPRRSPFGRAPSRRPRA